MREESHSSRYMPGNQQQQSLSPTRQVGPAATGLTYANYSYHTGNILGVSHPNVPVGEPFVKLETAGELFTMGPYRHSTHFIPFEYQTGPQSSVHGSNLNTAAMSQHRLHYINPDLLGSASSYNYGLYETQANASQYTATYDPFQGSPVQITSLSALALDEYESPATPDLPDLQHAESPASSNSKLSYKDVLSKSSEAVRSESPVFEASQVLLPPVLPGPPPAESENKRESYKDKLLSTSRPDSGSPAKSAASADGKAAPHTKLTNLNNHRVPGRHPPSQVVKNRLLNINNNLSATGVATKESSAKSKKNSNIQNDKNEAVRSVRSQTEPSPARPEGPVHSRSTSTGSKSRSASDSSDKDLVDFCAEETYINEVVRTKEKLKEKTKVKGREKERNESEKSRRSNRRGQQPTQQHSSRVLARAFLPRLYRGVVWFCVWLYSLCADIVTLSFHIAVHWLTTNGTFCCDKLQQGFEVCRGHVKSGLAYIKQYCVPPLQQFWNWVRRKNKNDNSGGSSGGLDSKIPLPTTGEEAMRRLLACKGRDPYSILGVTRDCSDEDIRRYYKKQAVLVHPDKNRQRGAEEAFKILAHAFELIGDSGRRAHYDNLVTEAKEMEAAWGELNELLSRLHAKMDEAANTIRCTNCAKRHRRIKTSRPCYAARYCKECKINHSARDGDLWAESRFMGFLCYYYACMEGAVYDITEWANCQATQLRHLTSNSHSVQYRIVPGSSQQQQQQQQQHHKKSAEPEEEDDWSEGELKGIFRDLNSRRMNAFDSRSSNAGQRRRNKRK